jgi:hypothetical protein
MTEPDPLWPKVTLTRDELIWATQGGVIRQIDALLKNRVQFFGDPQTSLWITNIQGCIGEVAAAKFFGAYWTPNYDNPSRVPDFGVRGQARSSSRIDAPLRMWEKDDPEHTFVRVWVQAPHCYLVGWLPGEEAMVPEWEKPPQVVKKDGKPDQQVRRWEVPIGALRRVAEKQNGRS